MALPILSFISSIFPSLVKVVDDLHTSEEEKLKVKQDIFSIQVEMFLQAEQYERELLESKAQIITAEAQGASWIQRSWRPITMLTFLGLVVFDSFGLLPFRLAAEAWTLLQIGLGGYVVGRSAEKIAPKITDVLKNKD